MILQIGVLMGTIGRYMVGALGPCGDGALGPCGGLKGCQRLYCPWLMSCLWFDCNQFSKKHHLYDCLVHCGWPFKIVFLFVVYCFLVLFICVSRLCSIAVHASMYHLGFLSEAADPARKEPFGMRSPSPQADP